jgi:DNA-directed RNA polymerase subunit RPC12/RpoP
VSIDRILIAIFLGYVILRIGLAMIRGLARPVPEPPPEGELRRVNLRYKCSICSTEIRMTKSVAEDPIAPRHCMDEMELIAKDGEALV